MATDYVPYGRPLKHALTDVDEELGLGTCAKCGRVRLYAAEGGRKLASGAQWACSRKPPLPAGENQTAFRRERNGRKVMHVLSAIDEQCRTGTCAKCGLVRVLEAKGSRARRNVAWVCSGRIPDQIGGHTKHVLSDVDKEAKTAICANCGPVTIIWRPFTNGAGRWGCIYTRHTIAAPATTYGPDYRPSICPYCNKPHRWDRRQGLACRARLHEIQKASINGTPGCAICHKVGAETLHVDHNHRTGQVRGLICHACNMALGYIYDNLETATALHTYLEEDGYAREWLWQYDDEEESVGGLKTTE